MPWVVPAPLTGVQPLSSRTQAISCGDTGRGCRDSIPACGHPPLLPTVTTEPGFRDHISVGVGSAGEQPFSGQGAGGQGGDWAPQNHLLGSLQLLVGQLGFGGVTPVPRMFGDGETSLPRSSSLWGSLGGFWGPLRPQ